MLDPFAGVGTCPVVCKKLKRHFIGIEKDEKFVAAANVRLAEIEHNMEESLFRYGT